MSVLNIYWIFCLNIAFIHLLYSKHCEHTTLNELINESDPAYPHSPYLNTARFSQAKTGCIAVIENHNLHSTSKDMFTWFAISSVPQMCLQIVRNILASNISRCKLFF